MDSLSRIANTLWQIVGNLGDLAAEIWQLGSNRSLLVLWLVWWLAAVNWTKLWPYLGKGAWVPLLLVANLAALVWSRLAPSVGPLAHRIFGGNSPPSWACFSAHSSAAGCKDFSTGLPPRSTSIRRNTITATHTLIIDSL